MEKEFCNKRSVSVELNDIRMLQISYLRNVCRYMAEGWPIVYIDETRINSSHTEVKRKSDDTRQGLLASLSKR
jgi:hypothetical protein